MKITILTLFPEMFDGFKTTSIIKRALQKDDIQLEIVNFRDYSTDRHQKVDDTPYGGGNGMVLSCQPIVDCLKAVKQEDSKVFLMAPTGVSLSQKLVRNLALNQHIVLVCGHYEGFDYRINNYVDGAISIGDYILTGGELAAQVISDAIFRVCDGVIAENSHLDESFENDFLEYPHYTKPFEFEGAKVPEILISGHHLNIENYRLKQSMIITKKYRKDLFDNHVFSDNELKVLNDDNIKSEIDL